jgi:hypothetical protein
MATHDAIWEKYRNYQDERMRHNADVAVVDAVIQFKYNRRQFYFLQGLAGGNLASKVYRDRLHEKFVELCN